MKIKVNFALGIILVFAFLSLASSLEADWTNYGSSTNLLNQNQNSSANADFTNYPVYQTNISNGQNQSIIPVQPIIASIGGSSFNFLMITNNTAINLYSFNATANGTIYASYTADYLPQGQLAVDNSGRVAGFFKENSSSLRYVAYTFNPVTKAFAVDVNESVFLTNSTYPSNVSGQMATGGVRCSGSECFGVINLKTNAGANHYYSYRYDGSSNFFSIFQPSLSYEYTFQVLEPPSKVDYDSNGQNEYLVWTPAYVIVYNSTSLISTQPFCANCPAPSNFQQVRGAKWIKVDGGNYKIAIVDESPYGATRFTCSTGYACARLKLRNVSGTETYNKVIYGKPASGSPTPRIKGFAIEDYNFDNIQDAWIVLSDGTPLNILSGNNGSVLFSNSTANIGGVSDSVFPNGMTTLGIFSPTGTRKSFVVYDTLGYVRIFDAYSNGATLFQSRFSSFNGTGSCIPADVTDDLYLDLICANQNSISVYTGNPPLFANSQPTIVSVAYTPSTSIDTATNLSISITATDSEFDTIYYRIKCAESESYTPEQTSNIFYCSYASAGTYKNIIDVRDDFSIFENQFNQTIIVTQYVPPEVVETSGGTPIPIQLVDIDDTEKGFLPEIYYGTLAFFSNVATPLIIVVFTIFFALIILAIGSIIKKIGQKIGS